MCSVTILILLDKSRERFIYVQYPGMAEMFFTAV